MALVDDGIVVIAQVLVGQGYDLFLGHLRGTLQHGGFVGPIGAVYKRLHEPVGASGVALQLVLLVEFEIIHRGFQQRFVKVAVAQLLQFAQQQVLHFVQRLPGLGPSGHHEHAVVGHQRGIGVGTQGLLLLRDVQVDEAGLTVVQDLSYHLHQFGIGVGGCGQAPGQGDVLGFQAQHFTGEGRGDVIFLWQVQHRQFRIGLQRAEVLVQRGNHLVGVEVAAEADGHVVGHVPRLVVLLDVGDGRVLQVLLRAQHRLRTVGVMGEEGGQHGLVHLARVARQRHVLLFVHRLQFRMEAADDTVPEAFGLNLGPLLYLVGGDVLGVAGDVEAGVGVGAVGADGGHQLVVFVGDGILGSLVGQAVYHMVDGLALGFVGGLAIDLELLFNLVQQRFLGLVVLRAEVRGALEHQVFEVVGQAGGFGGVVLAAHAYGDVGLDARFVLVDTHVDLQAVVQGVDTCLQRVIGHGLVLILRGAAPQSQGRQREGGQPHSFQQFVHNMEILSWIVLSHVDRRFFAGYTYYFLLSCKYMRFFHAFARGTPVFFCFLRKSLLSAQNSSASSKLAKRPIFPFLTSIRAG